MIRNRHAVLALLTALNLLNYLDRYMLAAVLDPMSKELHLSDSQGGLLGTAFLLGYFVTAPLFGAAADRSRRGWLIAVGVAIWSIATFATGFCHSYTSLLAARACVGFGEASFVTIAPTIIDDLTPTASKSRALAVFYLATPIGSALGFLLGGVIEGAAGWRAAFLIAGGPGFVLALACLLIAEPARKLREAKESLRAALGKLSRIPLFRRAVLGYCAYSAAVGAFSLFAPKFLHGFFPSELTNATAATWFGAVTVVGGAIGTWLGGWWSDDALRRLPPVTADTPWDAPANRTGINALLRVCAIGMAVAAIFTALALAMPSAWLFLGLCFFAEIGLFLSTSPVNAIGLRSVPPELRASAMAAMVFAIHLLGDLWSPFALGALSDAVGPLTAMAAIPLTFAVSALVWWPRAREAQALPEARLR